MRFLTGLLILLFAAGCAGNKGFVIVATPTETTDGFISPDALQMTSIGYANPQTVDPLKRKQEAENAAETYARICVIDYVYMELQADNPEAFRDFVGRVGQFTKTRYEPVWSRELEKGGFRVEEFFSMLGLRGYAHKQSYDAATGKAWVAYRVVRAGLVEYARRGFK